MIPLIAALVPLLPQLIQSVEALFGHGSGQEKFDKVTAIVTNVVSQLGATGKFGNVSDLTAAIPHIVELVVQQMKAAGQLTPTPSTDAQPLPPGTAAMGTLTFTNGVIYGVKEIPVSV